jgi:hypothetical protein
VLGDDWENQQDGDALKKEYEKLKLRLGKTQKELITNWSNFLTQLNIQ